MTIQLPHIRAACKALALVEIADLDPRAADRLTCRERARCDGFGPRRRQSFLAGRVALRQALGALAGGEHHLSDTPIETLHEDGVRPCCQTEHPLLSGAHVTIAHDVRFAGAAVDDVPVGLDIETPRPSLVTAHHLFLNEEEQALCRASPLGELQAALRAWSIKECVTKAFDLGMAATWHDARVIVLGEHRSLVAVRGSEWNGWHDEIDGHLVTLVSLRALR